MKKLKKTKLLVPRNLLQNFYRIAHASGYDLEKLAFSPSPTVEPLEGGSLGHPHWFVVDPVVLPAEAMLVEEPCCREIPQSIVVRILRALPL